MNSRATALSRLVQPRTTVRWRLTLLYGGLFLICGAALLAVTYTLVDHATIATDQSFIEHARSAFPVSGSAPPPKQAAAVNTTTVAPSGDRTVATPNATAGLGAQVPAGLRAVLRSKDARLALFTVGSQQRVADLHHLVEESSVALAIMALISGALGWLVAGRVLRPLRTMTITTQQISAASLDRRLAMEGPRDELRQLADTIDALLERLESAFDAQRRFVANASHELRTPLTTARAMLEMIISDPNATLDTFRTTCQHVLEEGEQQEQLIDALLALAQGQRGLDRRELLDLAPITRKVLERATRLAAERAVEFDVSLAPAPMLGYAPLVERLVSNLIDNAIRHNVPDGRVRVQVSTRLGSANVRVVNTGTLVPAIEVGRLLQPFQRLSAERVSRQEGLGLGLSIVAAIADAHDAQLDVHPATGGGLDVEVHFPPVQDGVSLPAAPAKELLDSADQAVAAQQSLY